MAESSAQSDKAANGPAQEPDGGSENVAVTQDEASADDSPHPAEPTASQTNKPDGGSESAAKAQVEAITDDSPRPVSLAASLPQETTGNSEKNVAPSAENVAASHETPQSELMQWRYRVLPTMQSILYFVTAVFFLSGLLQLGYLQWSILQGTKIDREDLPTILPQFADGSDSMLLEAARFEATLMLETYIVERRYHQANASLMTMAWIRYLGFSTGMILAIVGASFILGMLRESQTDLAAESAGWRFSLTSSSPGLIMVVLGVVLMFTTITHRQTLDVQDAAVYFDISFTSPTPEPTETPTRTPLTPLIGSSDE